jgi:pyridoxamine 5'-phosphate oxidase family protein
LRSTDPFEPRGVKIHGKARITHVKGDAGDAEYSEITPERYWRWGIEAPSFDKGKPVMRKVRLEAGRGVSISNANAAERIGL